MSSLHRFLFEPRPIAFLIQFRIALGFILLWEAYRYLVREWPETLFLNPPFLFKYYGFEWVQPLPEFWHLKLMPLLAILSVAFTFGAMYRLAAVGLFFGWAYFFLLEQALYLNHMYLVILVIGIMACLPAHHAFSVDAWLRPKLNAATVPAWVLHLLRFQVGVVYFFGGIAKLNADWLSGVPMQWMLLGNSDIFGQLAGEPAVAIIFAYGGLLLDLGIVPLLAWKKTRIFALALVTFFHISNHILFRIGIFPWTMLAATYILWPPRPLSMLNATRLCVALVGSGMLLTRILHPPGDPSRPVEPWAWSVVLVVGALLIFPPEKWRRFDFEQSPLNLDPPDARNWQWRHKYVLALLGMWCLIQIGLPLRHFIYPGNVSWHEQGHRWAWHMKLRVKMAAECTFIIKDEKGNILEQMDPFDLNSPLSLRQATTMSTRPDMALQFAHYLANQAKDRYRRPVQVTVENNVSLNTRPLQNLINPDRDLTKIQPQLWPPATWIDPLTTPRRKLERVDVKHIEQHFDFLNEIQSAIEQ